MRTALAAAVLVASAATARAEKPAQLDLADLDGAPHRLEELRGTPVLLNFWATWCIPCRTEMPILVGAAEDFDEFAFVAASADEPGEAETVRRDAGKLGLDVADVWTGATTRDMRRLGLGAALPATALIDAEGRVAWRVRGVVNEDALRAAMAALLRGEQPAPQRAAVALEHDHAHDAAHDHVHDQGAPAHGEPGHVHDESEGAADARHGRPRSGGSLVPS